jgi:lysyl-tRNA synthetase class 1
MSQPDQPSNYWLDQAADDILSRYPEGEIVVSSGISPSASYHIGHFREIMTAEALTWAIRQRDRQAQHIHVVDNFDPLRKRYEFLPEEFEQYVGQPVCLIPDPHGSCHASYADHYFAEFEASWRPMGIKPDQTIRSYEDLYQPNHMTSFIEKALENAHDIRAVFERLSNRELPETWTPVQLVGEGGRFMNGDLSTWDKDAKTLNNISYENGQAKLNWRLDWPARWAYLKVNVEPFGAQEHGAAGGSYETGRQFVEKVFGAQAPYDAARYGHIHLPGENIKMSSSKGNGITPQVALEIMPAEILRYFIVRGRPEKKIFFDPGVGLYNLIDEFAAVQRGENQEFRDALGFAVAVTQDGQSAITKVPFKHLVAVYQAARGNHEEVVKLLERTGWQLGSPQEHEALRRELVFVANWLDKFAPDEVKFGVQDTLPDANLSDSQRDFLSALATSLADQPGELDGDAMHKLIYAAKDEADLEAKEAFQALYRVILNKDFGPKAGWFLASLDRGWLIKRLQLQA